MTSTPAWLLIIFKIKLYIVSSWKKLGSKLTLPLVRSEVKGPVAFKVNVLLGFIALVYTGSNSHFVV